MPNSSLRYPLTLGLTLFAGTAMGADTLPELGSSSAAPRTKGDPQTCHELQQNFDIDLKEVVKAGCEPSTEQISKLMDNPVGNLVLLFNQFDYTALKGPHSNGTRYLGKYSFMPTLPIGLGAGRIFNFGKLPVRISGEVQYSVIHPDDLISSRWNFRLSFIPVIPTFMF